MKQRMKKIMSVLVTLCLVTGLFMHLGATEEVHAAPETKCQGLFSAPYTSLHEKSHCRFLHNGSKVIFYSLLITGKLVPKLKVSLLIIKF